MTDAQRVDVERWGFPNGIDSPAARCNDGYWTPWHIAQELLAAQAAEIERLQVQLAGCGVAAMGNTREALERNRLPVDAYGYSASYGDCWRAAEREITEREGREAAERARDECVALLREAQGNLYHPHEPAMIDSLESRIAAFLAANGAETTGARMRGVGSDE